MTDMIEMIHIAERLADEYAKKRLCEEHEEEYFKYYNQSLENISKTIQADKIKRANLDGTNTVY